MGASRREIERVVREAYGRLLAFLASRSRDLSAAEDALSDAFLAALSTWPREGIPDRPEAWLLTAAKRKLIDQTRREQIGARAREDLAKNANQAERMIQESPTFPDERLRLMFVCAHPAIDRSIRTPLMLQTVLGLDAATISSAFLVAPATMGQRLSRAKTKIRAAGIGFELPSEEELPARLAAVHEAIYAAFGLGWELAEQTRERATNLSAEAIWLGRITVDLLPTDAESKGLLALMLYSHARRNARRSEAGAYIPLDQQQTALWSESLIGEAEHLLKEASRLGSFGPFQIEAAIQSVHVGRRFTGTTRWPMIVQLYEVLLELAPTIGARIGYAAAVEHTSGAVAGLEVLSQLTPQSVETHQPFWAVKAHLHAVAGETGEALAAYDRAIGLSEDAALRHFLLTRRDRLTDRNES